MSLLRLTSALLTIAIALASARPAAADQVFSTASTGPVHAHATAPPYPIGDVYYSPCGYGGYGGYQNYSQRGTYGARGFGAYRNGVRGNGLGRLNGSTTLTGERFYPYDISGTGNRLHAFPGNGGFSGNGGYNGVNCYGNRPVVNPSPVPRVPMPAPYATRRP
jgi:hypothetical protein